ncbi:threonine dehydratase biosynthetic [Klebsiella pneumoniae]|uniref:Threonine dehydratase biosynthetic n=1 Tax=Klebsiella pneumoniae TaxID=573 RepID=A0A378AZ62_KLEPN|nr:threonine dehydratase biosynthetic [Klebsiella pneumoniae]
MKRCRKRRCKKWISSRRGLDNVILVKREDRQPVHSFKLRGAYAMMSSLTAEQKSHGVITGFGGQPCPGRGVFRIAGWALRR